MFTMTLLTSHYHVPACVIIIQIPIKKQDDVQEHVIDPNQVADSLLEITTSLNHETRYSHNVCLYCYLKLKLQ